MLSLTKDELTALRPCDLESHLPLFNSDEPLTVLAALEKGVRIPDLLWVAAKMGRRGWCARFALLCVQRVAHLSADPRVQQRLDAVAARLEDSSEGDRVAARAADDASRAAVDAAVYAVEAASRAAYDDDYATYAATYATYAATYAADAAVDAAADAAVEIEAQREIFISVFCS